ncbi:MAG TPA: hypothetical protein VFN37_12540 [Candidatus Baltobacteraceae bacterium]|nr:hypothetical protein [Candidatus Baltobacteraceae bacterium]
MDYIIGAGAILETGESGSITSATLHAQVDPALAQRVCVAAVDFEGTSLETMRRLLVIGQGWNGARFRSCVSDKLRARHECTLADVLRTLGEQAPSGEVHLFAHWFADDETCEALSRAGLTLVSHPLESIRAACLVSGQRCRRWGAVPAA